MDIHFNNVIPIPLSGIQHSDKSIWGSEFSLHKGEKVMLNASSGKGKTTFTHTLAGIRKDFNGSIRFDEREITSFSPEEWADLRKEQISFVFQDLQLFSKLTVEENLHLKNNLTDSFSSSELKQMLEELEIDDKWSVPCGILSMGQQQRVAIIRALCQPFDWLLMDEPFSNLDVENTQRALSLINNRVNDIKSGFILTTLGENHNFDFDRELNL
ncbi:ATP-binding cassette domain-containing protein [Brumimicrobium glaciale]|uniref:ATP-binding cassette domain-containing protein n=1 Tax=Brumimicrobium glaciale TaxID=200475 RepID=A0A4Q4KFG5_9FLAO|nr:ATP-binding cassette domain-containing protein [Brumimicrobium glaciale]RYM31458.1 ATP-binding cassette domain-containing protein [Brumimicrobium glaciale]